jgi:hypothetical protein
MRQLAATYNTNPLQYPAAVAERLNLSPNKVHYHRGTTKEIGEEGMPNSWCVG